VNISLKPIERLLLRTELALLVEAHCAPSDPLFADSGPSNAHCIVFPMSSTRIVRPRRPAVLENPTAVSFLNRGEEYGRQTISEEGSHAVWYTLEDELLQEVLFDAHCASDEAAPFSVPQIYVPLRTIVKQRCLFARLAQQTMPDGLSVEEDLLELTRDVFGARSEARRSLNPQIVRRALEYLLVNFARPLSLADIARAVAVSPSHLSRAFHTATGMTMSHFRQSLRLIKSLDLLPAYGRKLTDLALELGYSSHSHFTSRFRAFFDLSPTHFIQAQR
jgi:AraC-like DNA-binding protein